ncbi:acyl carrier protein, partial [Sphaerisporangium dianthi]
AAPFAAGPAADAAVTAADAAVTGVAAAADGAASPASPAAAAPALAAELAGPVGLRVAEQIAQELCLPVGRLNLRRPLCSMGLDSLMAAKLSGRLREDPGVEISPRLLLGGLPLGDVIARLSPGTPT